MEEIKGDLQAAIDYIKNDVYLVIGVLVVQHFKQAFRLGGLGKKKWQPQEIPRTGSTDGQNVLIRTGDLMESIDYRVVNCFHFSNYLWSLTTRLFAARSLILL